MNDKIEKKELYDAITSAVDSGGYTKVYIADDMKLIVSSADRDYQEFAGHNVIYTIDCPSAGDMGYDSIDDFEDPDIEQIFKEDLDYLYEEGILEY